MRKTPTATCNVMRFGTSVLLAQLLNGCAQVQPPPAPPPAPAPEVAPVLPVALPPPPQPTVTEVRLKEAHELYDSGDFKAAIRLLSGNREEITKAGTDEQKIEAYKLLAFSNCVLGQKVKCRDEFKAILDIQPNFELKAIEAGHPLWGPVFKRLKESTNVAPTPTPAPKPSKSKSKATTRSLPDLKN